MGDPQDQLARKAIQAHQAVMDNPENERPEQYCDRPHEAGRGLSVDCDYRPHRGEARRISLRHTRKAAPRPEGLV
jgi:hypothetical protein